MRKAETIEICPFLNGIPDGDSEIVRCNRSEALPVAKRVIETGKKIHLKQVVRSICSNKKRAKGCPVFVSLTQLKGNSPFARPV